MPQGDHDAIHRRSYDGRRAKLLDALNRLQKGIPNNKELAKKARDNKLKITFSSVAKEAGCSRTLIGFDGCAYQDIRNKIQKIIGEKSPPGAILSEAIQHLGHEILQLRHKVDERDMAYARLIRRLRGNTAENMLDPIATAQKSSLVLRDFLQEDKGVSIGALKQKIRSMREEAKSLKLALAERDTAYANLLLVQRALDRGMHPDSRPLNPSTKAERQRAMSIVGRSMD